MAARFYAHLATAQAAEFANLTVAELGVDFDQHRGFLFHASACAALSDARNGALRCIGFAGY